MDLLAIPLAFIGLMAGLLLWSRIVYVSYGIYSAVTKVDLRSYLRDHPTDRQISNVLRALVAASLVWVLAFGAIALHFGSKAESVWAWFFGGIAATPVLVAVTTFKALRQLKKIRAGVQL